MKTRSFLIYAAVFLLLGLLVCFYIGNVREKDVPSYPTEINRLLIRLGEDWDEVRTRNKMLITSEEPFDYAVIDTEGNLLFYTREDMAVSESAAATHYDVIRDIKQNDVVVGKLLVHNPYKELQIRKNRTQAMVIGALFLGMLAVSGLYFFYLKKKIVEPFDRLKEFSTHVAAGNLEVPLEMDRGNVFGAFTEAFDIMRDELHASKLREAEAVQSRKELVAQLSHDIKTPVTSIKAMTDVMELTAGEEEKSTLRSINAKADQIDTLVSNLFHATLEELEHLEVKTEEVTSRDIAHYIEEADYLKKVKRLPIRLEDAVVSADPLRLNQVISNIFANSYKYADTDMTVESRIEKSVDARSFLVIEIGDKGPGVPEEEIEMIFGKFKRGTNAEGKDGAGLGLYISRYLMEKMGGEITCMNREDGFVVVLRLPLL